MSMSLRRYGRAIVGDSIVSDYEPLTDSQIMRVAPSVYAGEQHESRSEKYVYVPTKEILEILKKEGFFTFFAAQSKSRIPGKTEFTKHMLRLRPKQNFTGIENTGEIILINSHDGTSSYKMMAGVFRFVCQNGLMIGDTTNDYAIHHKGNIKNDILEAAYEITDNFQNSITEIDKMKAIELKPVEKQIFAEAALELRYEEEEAPIESNQLLRLNRYEDKGNDLWKTYNVIQENTIKGGLHGRTKNGKKTTTRKVKSIDNNVKLNKALWILTEKMAKLKG